MGMLQWMVDPVSGVRDGCDMWILGSNMGLWKNNQCA